MGRGKEKEEEKKPGFTVLDSQRIFYSAGEVFTLLGCIKDNVGKKSPMRETRKRPRSADVVNAVPSGLYGTAEAHRALWSWELDVGDTGIVAVFRLLKFTIYDLRHWPGVSALGRGTGIYTVHGGKKNVGNTRGTVAPRLGTVETVGQVRILVDCSLRGSLVRKSQCLFHLVEGVTVVY